MAYANISKDAVVLFSPSLSILLWLRDGSTSAFSTLHFQPCLFNFCNFNFSQIQHLHFQL